jgi:hypothetical protein
VDRFEEIAMFAELFALSLLTTPMTCIRASEPLARIFIEFPEGGSEIDGEDATALTEAARWASRDETLRLGVYGYADKGDSTTPSDWSTEDLELARLRSNVVFDRLIADGVSSDRMGRDAYGLRGKGGITRDGEDGRGRYTTAVVVVTVASPPVPEGRPVPTC